MTETIHSQGFEYGVKHFTNSLSGNLVDIIATSLDQTPTEVEVLLNLGAVYLNNKRQNTNLLIQPEQQIRVHTKPRRYSHPVDWLSRVVYDSRDFIVLNKPCGFPSHPSVDNKIENALTQLSQASKSHLLITHRLDTLTEGLIVYAKSTLFAKSFNFQLQNHQIEKKYCALVESEKTLPVHVIHYMEPSPRAPKKVSQTAQDNWAMCELEILEQKKIFNATWLKINLLTGRTHQIRSQLAELGAPIVGDQLYGAQKKWRDQAIALRAVELQFNWAGQRMFFSLPEDFDYSL